MRRLEVLGLRIIGVLLILLGITLFLSPRVTYTTHEQIRNTRYRVQREKVVRIPRPVAVLIAAGGAFVWILMQRLG